MDSGQLVRDAQTAVADAHSKHVRALQAAKESDPVRASLAELEDAERRLEQVRECARLASFLPAPTADGHIATHVLTWPSLQVFVYSPGMYTRACGSDKAKVDHSSLWILTANDIDRIRNGGWRNPTWEEFAQRVTEQYENGDQDRYHAALAANARLRAEHPYVGTVRPQAPRPRPKVSAV